MYLNEIKKGITTENPLFIQVLGLCPSLAVTTSLKNAIGMGVAFTAVLIFSNIIISSIRKSIPDNVRIPVFIVIIASFVACIEMLMNAYFPAIYVSLGIFLPLIVVNCIILARAESFASKKSPFLSFLDALGMGIGFSGALILIASIRELLGNGTLLDIAVLPSSFQPLIIMILPPGAFITMAFIFATINIIARNRRKVEG